MLLLELGTIWIFLSATLATSYLPISEFPNKLPISSLEYFNKVLVDPLVYIKSQQDLIIPSKPVRGYSKESRSISTSSKFLMQYNGASEVTSHVTGENLILELVERPSSRMKRSYLNRNYEDGPFFEGDIILPDHQHPDWRNIVKDTSLIWPNGQVPYQFDSGFTNDQKITIENALTSLMKDTCVRFVKRTNQANYVNVKNSGQGCASLVGYQHTPQDVQLTAPACLIKPGTIQHEFLHALGFWHEHTRPDRDTYIKIAWQNIQSGTEVNFKARLSSEAQTFGLPYDYGSVMHYRATAFSKDGNSATIVPSDNDELFKIGQREKASTIDLAKLNKLYKCNTSFKHVNISPQWNNQPSYIYRYGPYYRV